MTTEIQPEDKGALPKPALKAVVRLIIIAALLLGVTWIVLHFTTGKTSGSDPAVLPAPTNLPATTAYGTNVLPTPVKPAPGVEAKRKRLEQLLEDYKNDRITAAEYHKERQRIISEP